MTVTETLVSRNAAYSTKVLARGGLAAKGTQKVAVVACMDSRVDVFAALGLTPGEAHVIRNAGGLVTEDTIRSLAISQHLMGTEEILVIHHTGCGMLSFTDEELCSALEAQTGARPTWAPGAFTDLADSVRHRRRAWLRPGPGHRPPGGGRRRHGVTLTYFTRFGVSWPGVVRTERAPGPRGVHPSSRQ